MKIRNLRIKLPAINLTISAVLIGIGAHHASATHDPYGPPERILAYAISAPAAFAKYFIMMGFQRLNLVHGITLFWTDQLIFLCCVGILWYLFGGLLDRTPVGGVLLPWSRWWALKDLGIFLLGFLLGIFAVALWKASAEFTQWGKWDSAFAWVWAISLSTVSSVDIVLRIRRVL